MLALLLPFALRLIVAERGQVIRREPALERVVDTIEREAAVDAEDGMVGLASAYVLDGAHLHRALPRP